jgi:lantibiotic modifying enzyme
LLKINAVYYGAAHGTAGILLSLKRLGNAVYKEEFEDFLSHCLFPSGNMRSSSTSKSDRLVQWCHGSPGLVPLILDYYDFNPSRYCTVLSTSLDVIWERGLLHKGAGICHGIAGNGYAFLSAYCKLEDIENWSKALIFALQILDQVIEYNIY